MTKTQRMINNIKYVSVRYAITSLVICDPKFSRFTKRKMVREFNGLINIVRFGDYKIAKSQQRPII